MKRIMNAIRLDFIMQMRYGFLFAAFFSIIVWVAVIYSLPGTVLPKAVPAIVFFDIAIVGFYFIAGLVIYEKSESTLYALVVSPLRFWEYLFSKLLTLTLLAVVLATVLVGVSYGLNFNFVALVLGTAIMSLISLLIGFIAVSPFSSFSSYLIPSQVYATLLYLPLIDYSGWWSSSLFYILPTHGALRLMYGAFEPIPAWEVWYAILYGIVCVCVLSMIAKRMFTRYVVAWKGGV